MELIKKENTTTLDYTFKFKDSCQEPLIGVDIGGSLAKIVIASNNINQNIIEFLRKDDTFTEVINDNFSLFISKIPTVNFLKSICPLTENIRAFTKLTTFQATGGGAYRFKQQIQKLCNIKMEPYDELLSLVNGYLFMNEYSPFYRIGDKGEVINVPPSDLTFPHLAVNIGSGVSILKVSSPNGEVVRVGGTKMGGEVFTGFGKILLGEGNFSSLLELADKGDYTKTDFTNREVYGEQSQGSEGCYSASSFAKIHHYMGNGGSYNKEDIAKSLLLLICSNLSQLVSIFADKYNVGEVRFFGNFTVKGSCAVKCLNKCMKIYGSNIKVRFNIYEGFLGAIGTLVNKA